MAVRIRARDGRGRFARASDTVSGPKRASASAPGSDTVNTAASSTAQAMAAWNPGNYDVNVVHAFENRSMVDRARDLVANNPFAAAAVDRRVSMTVGLTLRYTPQHEVMAKLLGISSEAASALASQIEAAWESWANDPLFRNDWEQEQPFGGQANLAERHHFVDGEALALMRWDETPGWRWRTSLQVIDPDRLGNPFGRLNDRKIVNGIETDGRRNIAYHIREAHPADFTAIGANMRFERVPAREEWGRPVVLHLRTKTRAGMKRGVTRFASAMKLFKQTDQYTEAELSSALLNAIFGGYITTTKTAGEAGEALGIAQLAELGELRQEFYKGTNPKLSNGARIPVLAPGDDFKLNAVPRHVQSFQGFLTTSLQAIAAPLGLAGSQLTMDFSKTNFSSWRGEMLQVWRDVLQGRQLVTTQFASQVLLCVIEEAIDNGDIDIPAGCPGLYENPAGWLAGRWIGPSRGTIDPEGEVKGAVARIGNGLSTFEIEALEANGSDYQANAGQLAWERDLFLGKGLTPIALRAMLEAVESGAPSDPQPENANTGNVVTPPPEPPSESTPA